MGKSCHCLSAHVCHAQRWMSGTAVHSTCLQCSTLTLQRLDLPLPSLKLFMLRRAVPAVHTCLLPACQLERERCWRESACVPCACRTEKCKATHDTGRVECKAGACAQQQCAELRLKIYHAACFSSVFRLVVWWKLTGRIY